MAQRLESKSNNQIYHYLDLFIVRDLFLPISLFLDGIAIYLSNKCGISYAKSVIERILKVFGNPAIAVKIRGPRSRAGLIA